MPCAVSTSCERVHAAGRFVDAADEGDRSLQDRLQRGLVLDAGLRVLVLDHEVGLGDVERQQLAGGQLVIQPVDAAVLQVGQRIVPRRPGQLVLGEHDLLLPGVEMIRGVGRRLAVDPVAALHRLAAAPPRRPALGVGDLALHVEAADQEVVALVLEVLEHRARVLVHQDGVRRIVVDAELVADAVLLGDAVQRDPGARRVGDVVVPVVAGGPAGHRALLDAIGQRRAPWLPSGAGRRSPRSPGGSGPCCVPGCGRRSRTRR